MIFAEIGFTAMTLNNRLERSRRLGPSIVLLFLSACNSHAVVVELPTQDLHLVFYRDHEHISDQCDIHPDSVQFGKLSVLLKSLQDNWRRRFGDLGPAVEILGPGVKLDFRDNTVSLDYGGAEYMTSIPGDAYAFLTCPGK